MGYRQSELISSATAGVYEEQIVFYSSTVSETQKYPRLLSAGEIAGILRLNVQTVYTMARRGEPEKIKLSRKCLRFRADDVERFIKRKSAV